MATTFRASKYATLRLVLTATLLLVITTLPVAARDALKLLTIGNSFSDYPLSCLTEIASAGGKTLVLGRLNNGGTSLQRHAAWLEAAMADPADPKGRPYKNSPVFNLPGRDTVSLPEALAAQAWDVVTIQQLSGDSYKPETYHPAVDQLIAAIRRHAPQAEIVVQETWVYRDDHPAFQGKDGFDQEKMYAGVRAAYHQLADAGGFRIIPSGDAMELARKTPRWTFVPDKNFDFKNPPAGQLPRESGSLWAGWSWFTHKSGKTQLILDGKHPSTAGKYLCGVVWYQTLFETDEVPAGYVPRGLTAADTADLRIYATQAVQAERSREATRATR